MGTSINNRVNINSGRTTFIDRAGFRDSSIYSLEAETGPWHIANPGGSTDPDFASVTLLLPMDSDFNDVSNSARTPTLLNAPTIDATEKQFGAGSGKFLKASSQYLQFAHTADLNFGSNDWTIEWWSYMNTGATQFSTILDKGDGGGAGAGPFWINVGPDGLGVSLDTSPPGFEFTHHLGFGGPLPVQTWSHFAVTRDGSNFRMFIDGVQVDSTTSATAMADTSSPLKVGARGQSGSSLYFDGFIDDLRITNGVARYTSGFSVPTAAFPTS